MRSFSISSLAVLVFLASVSSSLGLDKTRKAPSNCLDGPSWNTGQKIYQEWDHLSLSLQWSPTMCIMLGKNCSHKSVKSNWTIHGLWPDKGDRPIICCNNTWYFDPHQIDDIRSKMENQWPSIDVTAGDRRFWSHEWLAHGTCAAQLALLDSQHKYFSETLELRAGIDIYGMLAREHIKPSNTLFYDLASIRLAIEKGLGHSIGLFCYYPNSESSYSHKFGYIFEVRICYDASLKIISCEKPCGAQCNDEDKIMIPPKGAV